MILAISGKRGVGKSLAANYLSLNYGFKVVSFSKRLKEVARVLFDFQDKDLYGANKEQPFGEYNFTPRDFLIQFGAFMRYYDELYWVKSALKGQKGNYVVDDLRFENEAKHLTDLGAVLIRMERYKKYNPYKGEITDPSETQLDAYTGFRFKINELQNLSITSLHNNLDWLMEELGVEKK